MVQWLDVLHYGARVRRVCVGPGAGAGGGSVFDMPFQSYGEPLPITLIATRLRKSLHM